MSPAVVLIVKFDYQTVWLQTYRRRTKWFLEVGLQKSRRLVLESYFPNSTPSWMVSGRRCPCVSGSISDSNPATTEEPPNTTRGTACPKLPSITLDCKHAKRNKGLINEENPISMDKYLIAFSQHLQCIIISLKKWQIECITVEYSVGSNRTVPSVWTCRSHRVELWRPLEIPLNREDWPTDTTSSRMGQSRWRDSLPMGESSGTNTHLLDKRCKATTFSQYADRTNWYPSPHYTY